MPYKLDDFPIKTSEPTIEVTLPEGTHVFELVVEDTAGLKSLADRVVVTVKIEKPAPPIITNIEPRFGSRGETLTATVHGKHLQYTKEMAFLRGKKPDDGIGVTGLKWNKDGESVTITAQVKSDAELGSRPFRVVTQGGSDDSTDSGTEARFRVVDKPTITKILPAESNPGETTKMLVFGTNLFLEGEPATDHHVDFLLQGNPVKTIVAEVKEESKPNQLVVSVIIPADAKTTDYTVVVTTPAGHIATCSQTFKVY